MTGSATGLHTRPALEAMPAHRNSALLPNLDGVRALACILVVLSHMPWPHKFETLGEVGVGVFFVLSGFLMGHLYGHARWDFDSVSQYCIARFSRIAPIYWLVVTLCIAISYAWPDTDFLLRITGGTSILRHYLFGGNVLIFWSIPLEVQYYLFFIFVWWALAASRLKAFALPLLALVCAALLVSHLLWTGLSLPNKLHFFLAGTLAGLAPRPVLSGGSEPRWLGGFQLLAVLLLAAPLWQYSSKPALYAASELGLSLALAVWLLAIPGVWSSKLLAAPWLRKIGQASFSIYLTHVLVFHLGMRLLGLNHDRYEPLWLLLGLAGIALPMLVSHWVELPLQRHTRKWLQSRLAAFTRRPARQAG